MSEPVTEKTPHMSAVCTRCEEIGSGTANNL